MLDDDGYGKLGFYSNAVVYLGLGIGSIAATAVMNKIGERLSMVIGGFLCIPFLAFFIFPALKQENPDSDSVIYSSAFVYVFNLIFSIMNGLGESTLWVA